MALGEFKNRSFYEEGFDNNIGYANGLAVTPVSIFKIRFKKLRTSIIVNQSRKVKLKSHIWQFNFSIRWKNTLDLMTLPLN